MSVRDAIKQAAEAAMDDLGYAGESWRVLDPATFERELAARGFVVMPKADAEELERLRACEQLRAELERDRLRYLASQFSALLYMPCTGREQWIKEAADKLEWLYGRAGE